MHVLRMRVPGWRENFARVQILHSTASGQHKKITWQEESTKYQVKRIFNGSHEPYKQFIRLYQQQKFNSGKYRPEDVNLHTIDTENIKQWTVGTNNERPLKTHSFGGSGKLGIFFWEL